MGFEISELMGYRRTDIVLRKQFTPLHLFVCPVFKPADDLRPLLQVFDIYEAGTQFRVILSDGDELQEAILAPKLFELARRNEMTRGSIIRLSEYDIYSNVHSEFDLKRVIMILRVEVLVADFRIVGNPTHLCWEEWKEEDWNEDTWEWCDPEEQEYETEDEDEEDEDEEDEEEQDGEGARCGS